MDYYAIGQRIRRVRRARKLSQEELSGLVGISVTHMSHIETGNTKLSLSVFADLAAALEVRADELLHDNAPAERQASFDSILKMLGSCTTQQVRVIEDVLKATKASLDQHFPA